MPAPEASSSKRYWIVLFLLAAFSLWLRTGFPLTALPALQHDDRLFVRLARYLAAGQWLGPYDDLTLAKGMFYPFFVTLAFWTSVPLLIAEHVVYLLASAFTAGVVRRATGSGRIALFLFGLLALNPVSWNYNLARVIRQGLYLSLCLAVITLLITMAFPARRPDASVWRRIIWPGVGLGFVTAAYWLTREEGIWLLPAAAVIMGVATIGILGPSWALRLDDTPYSNRRSHFKAILAPLCVALVTFTAAVFTVAGINYHYYGILETTEFRASAFLRAHGALTRIQQDHWRQYIAFPKDARQRAYEVSPAARELQPSLEGPLGAGWLKVSCEAGHARPCDEVEVGWGMWEFRDAVAAAGHYRSGADAMRFYDQIANEINSACSAGRISCLPLRATFTPRFRSEYLRSALKNLKPVSRAVFTMNDTSPIAGSPPSDGPEEGVAMFADIVDGVLLPRRSDIVIDGWAASLSATPRLQLVPRDRGEIKAGITLLASPDVFKVFPNYQSTRFELKTDCPLTECDFIVDVPGVGETKIPLVQLAHRGATVDFSGHPERMIFVDIVSGMDVHTLQDENRTLKVKIAARLASLYARLFPWLAALAVFGLLIATFFRRHFPLPLPLLALGLASATAAATMTVLMSYLAATADMNTPNVLYTSPASPFVITFTVLGLYSWFIAFRSYREPLRHKRPRPFVPFSTLLRLDKRLR